MRYWDFCYPISDGTLKNIASMASGDCVFSLYLWHVNWGYHILKFFFLCGVKCVTFCVKKYMKGSASKCLATTWMKVLLRWRGFVHHPSAFKLYSYVLWFVIHRINGNDNRTHYWSEWNSVNRFEGTIKHKHMLCFTWNTFEGLCRGSGRCRPLTAEAGGHLRPVLLDLWWAKWQLEMLLSKYLRFSVPVPPTNAGYPFINLITMLYNLSNWQCC
jgi:hypothetical protein